jgi:hypothetical protein
MAPRFFGQWLVSRGRITSDQLLAALDMQLETNKDLGAFALQANILTDEQVNDIRREERETNRRFEELAIEKSLLTPEQVERLVERQRGQRRFVGEIIAEQGFMLYRDVMTELDLFRADQAGADRTNEGDSSTIPSEAAKEQADDPIDAKPYLSACLSVLGQILRHEIRLIDVQEGASPQQDYTIYKMLNSSSYVALSLGTNEMVHVANAMSGGEFITVNPMVFEAAKEILHVIVRNIDAGFGVEEGSRTPEPVELLSDGSKLPGAAREVTCFLEGPAYALELLIGR